MQNTRCQARFFASTLCGWLRADATAPCHAVWLRVQLLHARREQQPELLHVLVLRPRQRPPQSVARVQRVSEGGREGESRRVCTVGRRCRARGAGRLAGMLRPACIALHCLPWKPAGALQLQLPPSWLQVRWVCATSASWIIPRSHCFIGHRPWHVTLLCTALHCTAGWRPGALRRWVGWAGGWGWGPGAPECPLGMRERGVGGRG